MSATALPRQLQLQLQLQLHGRMPRWTGWAVTGVVHAAMLLALMSAFATKRPPTPALLTINARLVPSATTPSPTLTPSVSVQLPRSALTVPPIPDIPPPPVQIEAAPTMAAATTPLRFDPPAAAAIDQNAATARPVAVAAVTAVAAAAPPPPATIPTPASADSPAQLPADHRACSAQQTARHYPAMLRDRGIQGQVVLRVKVDADGHAAEVVVSGGSGWRLLDEAARRVAESCPFIPARRGDQRLVSWVEYPVRFALQASPLQ
ncbi:energy transducer TonB [Mitsuaria sp. 7]|uniref:energy transducer TonB n=1 Tax=Mitsuaria sp. 7 TaxID=1658665 RepID=UPI000835A11F|nr:energy transducer TonB [Mitsuaria sp. 7]